MTLNNISGEIVLIPNELLIVWSDQKACPDQQCNSFQFTCHCNPSRSTTMTGFKTGRSVPSWIPVFLMVAPVKVISVDAGENHS